MRWASGTDPMALGAHSFKCTKLYHSNKHDSVNKRISKKRRRKAYNPLPYTDKNTLKSK